MQRNVLLTLLTAAGLCLSAANAPRESQQLQQAIDLMETKGDLAGAIRILEQAAKSSDRSVAARSLLYLGDCRRKLGQQEASKSYERIVREFADLRDVAREAQARLASLRPAKSTPTGIVARQVWTGEAVDTGGTISPDGKLLSFTDWKVMELAVHDFSSGTSRHVTKKGPQDDPNAYPEESAISRDGSTVAYAWFNGKRYELRLTAIGGNDAGAPRVLFSSEEVLWVAPFDWSPDGRLIAVQIQRMDRTAQIGLLSVQSGSLRVLKSVAWRGATKLLFSPDGKYVAYDLPASDETDQRDVFIMATDASKESKVLAGPADETVIAWTPDGKRLLFSSDRGGAPGLWAIGVRDGALHDNPTMVRADVGTIRGLGISREGALYLGEDAGGWEIAIATVDPKTGKRTAHPEQPVQNFMGVNRDPAFSRDGKYLSYQSLRGRSSLVLAIRSLETGQVRELRPDLSYFNQADWAPDGQSIAVRGRDNKGRDGIFRIDAQTGAVTQLIPGGEIISGTMRPLWSADGRTMFFRRVTSDEHILMRRDLASGADQVVYRTKAFAQPRLSPDGATFVMIDGRSRNSIKSVPMSGGEARELAKAGEGEAFGQVEVTADGQAVIASKRVKVAGGMAMELWRIPLSGGAPQKLDLGQGWKGGMFSVHPDGRRIAFTQGTRRREVWTVENFLPALQASR